MSIEELIKKTRCRRRFYNAHKVSDEILYKIVSSLRYISSAKNLQPLKYIISTNENKNDEIFSTLKWAGYFKDWDGPEKEERPSAYIVILKDKTICDEAFVLTDAGIAVQTIMLYCTDLGLGSCTIAAIDKKRLTKILELPAHLEILYVMAIGKPKGSVVVTQLKDSIKYFKDDKGNHYVPKRDMKELLVKKYT